MKDSDIAAGILCSIIIPALESYEVVRRQFLHFGRFLPDHWELIIIDDCSRPTIESYLASTALSNQDNRVMELLKKPNFKLPKTQDYRSWAQPAASNVAALIARGKYLLHTDIDHIIPETVIKYVEEQQLINKIHKINFPRMYGVFDETGLLCRDKAVLMDYGMAEAEYDYHGSHANTFVMKKEIFWMLGGYTERLIGEHGGDDTRFNDAYGAVARPNGWESLVGPMTFVYPDPSRDKNEVFHGLRRWKGKTGSYDGYKKQRELSVGSRQSAVGSR